MRALWICVGAVAVGVAGCGRDGVGKTVPVTGKVFVGDKPLPRGTVTFYPDEKKGAAAKHEARGAIESDGTYRLKTRNTEGAAPGWYKIVVVATEDTGGKEGKIGPGGMPAPPASLIPHKYANVSESGLTMEVVENAEAGKYDIKLTAGK